MEYKGYKGYKGYVIFDEDANIFHGEVLCTKDIITFQGASVKELEKEFHKSVDVYLDLCKKKNKKPDKQYSGKFNLRISPELHRELEIQATKEKTSLNSYIISKLKSTKEKIKILA